MIRLEDVLKMSWRRFCQTCWRGLENVLKTSWKRLEDVLKTYSQGKYTRRLKDVFWRRKAEANIFVLIKTSWRRLEDVFRRRRRKTSSKRLQDVFIKASVCWVVWAEPVNSKKIFRHAGKLRQDFFFRVFIWPYMESSFLTPWYFFCFFYLACKLFKGLFQSHCQSVNCISWVFES